MVLICAADPPPRRVLCFWRRSFSGATG